MGEVMPAVIAGFAILVVIAVIMAKTQLNRKAVVKPLDQEDMVERVKIRLTGEQVQSLARRLSAANDEAFASGKSDMSVETYDGAGRLVRFEIVKGEKSEKG